ncbi:MAG TPA: hypothetical protein VK449_03845 [Anaerolineales bacterium]|nr:hypothetical protein [Anaerolineales bacterium]
MSERTRASTALPFAGLALVLLIALATLGVGYGLWAKTLTINGEVHTGRVDARWLFGGCFEFNSWPDFPTEPGDYGEAEGKDVGTWSVRPDSADDQNLLFRIDNGYPSYAVDCEVHFQNDGTIPVRIRGFSIGAVSPNLTGCRVTDGNPIKLECDQLTVYYYDGLGMQLHPGEQKAGSLVVHVEQPADPLSTYEFEVGICMAQWNEGATLPECFSAAPAE